jgi:predicted dehydrogenase
MRVSVIGSGSIGRRHVANLRALVPDAHFTFWRASGAHDDYTRQLGARVVSSLEQCLAEAPDLAIIANPSAFHAEPLLQVLRAGIPFYIEKPIVTGRAAWNAVAAQIAAIPALPPNVVGCNLRYLPSLIKLRRIIADSRLGRVVRATMQAGQWLPDWRPHQDYRHSYSASRRLGGGVIYDLVHEIDAARWLLGEFVEVRAFAGRLSSLEIETEDAACALLSGASMPLTCIGLDYVSRVPLREYRIIGDCATATWSLAQRELRVETPHGVHVEAAGSEDFDIAATYVSAMKDLLAAVRDNGRTQHGIEDGMRTADLMLRIREEAGLPADE